MRTLVVSTCLLFGVAALVACGGGVPAPTSPHAPAAALKAPGEAKVGERTTCPVSGEEFVVKVDSPKVEHEGKTYFFCCPGCDQRFEAEPQKYLRPANPT